jgi:hypothetical protein
MRVTHLNKSGSGMASKTACGRNILRTPISVNWAGFKQEPKEYRCIKCASSKQFEVNAKMDAKKANSAFENKAPFNPEFLGAQPARAGEDY